MNNRRNLFLFSLLLASQASLANDLQQKRSCAVEQIDTQEEMDKACPGLKRGDPIWTRGKVSARLCDLSKPVYPLSNGTMLCTYYGLMQKDVSN